MNKSKFLKKSIAMLLAVMMVVAMIPFSASAAGGSVFIDGDVVSIKTTNVALEGTAPNFSIKLPYYAGENAETVEVTMKTAFTDAEVKATTADGEDDVDITVASNAFSFSFDNDVTKVTITPVKADETKGTTYTITVSQDEASAVTTLKSAKVGTIEGKIDNTKKTISFEFPWGFDAEDKPVTIGMDYPTQVAPTATLDEDGSAIVEIFSQNGKQSEVYSITSTWEECLTSLTIGGVAAKLVDEDNPYEYAVELPAGTKLATAKQAISFTTASTPKTKLWSAYDETEDTWGEAVAIVNGAEKLLADGGKYMLSFEHASSTEEAPLGISYVITVSVAPSSAAEITAFTVTAGGYTEKGTVSGKMLTATIPYASTAGNNLKDVALNITASAGAIVTVNATQVVDGDDQPVAGHYNLTGSATTPVIIKVVAANGTNDAYYQLSVVEAEAPNKDPKIEAAKITLGSNEYAGTIKDQAISFKVPYSTRNAQLTADKFDFTTTFATNAVMTLDEDFDFYASNAKAEVEVTSDSGDKVTYTVTVSREKPLDGKNISNFTFTEAQTDEDEQTNENTFKVTFGTAGTASVKFPYAYKFNGGNSLVPQFTISEGAALYISFDYENLHLVPVYSGYVTEDDIGTEIKFPSALTVGVYEIIESDVGEPWATIYNGMLDPKIGDSSSEGVFIFAVADETAKVLIEDALDDEDTVAVADLTTGDYKNHVAVYKLGVTYAEGETGHTLTALTADDGLVTSTLDQTKGTIEITVPASYTVASADDLDDVAFYANYTASKRANVLAGGDEGGVILPQYISNIEGLQPGALGVVKTSDATTLYICTIDLGDDEDDPSDDTLVWVPVEAIAVLSEVYSVSDGETGGSTSYDVTVKAAAAKTEAEVLTVKLNGVSAKVSGKTITATLPNNTDLTAVEITYTVSPLAEAAWTPSIVTDNGKDYIDLSAGKATVAVTAEDGKTIKTFDLTVTLGEKFKDNTAKTTWYYEYINAAYEAGIVKGVSSDKFGVGTYIKRKDFAVMIVRLLMGADAEVALKSNSDYATTTFTDVADDYAIGAIAYCQKNGIIGGVGGGKFNPDGNVTREQAAKMISLALKLSTTPNPELSYADAESIATWAVPHVAAVGAAKIMTGSGKNFVPQGNVTREQAAKMMVIALDNK